MQILIWLTSNHWTTWRSTTRWTRTFEGLRGARMFHLVSLSLQISLADLPGPCLGLCVGVACFWLVLFLVGFFLPGKFDFNLMLIPVVDRPCLALVRQCRKKKWLVVFWPPGEFLPLISFLSYSNFQLLTDHVSYSPGNAGKKSRSHRTTSSKLSQKVGCRWSQLATMLDNVATAA